MEQAAAEGYRWVGIYVTDGPLRDPQKLEAAVRASNPGATDIKVIRNAAIPDGTQPHYSGNKVTVYVK